MSGNVRFFIAWVATALGLATFPAWAGSREQAIRLFDRLAGVPIGLSDPRLAQMESLISEGKTLEAAAIATADDRFYNITVRHFATPMSNQSEDSLESLNDFVATVIGATRDELDARTLLNGNYIYKADPTVTGTLNGRSIQSDISVYQNNDHYDYLESSRVNLRQKLVRANQKTYLNGNSNGPASDLTDTAGLITTRAWAEAHFTAGTNRRPLQFAFSQFLCLPLAKLQDASVPDNRVRRDVDRIPGGNVQTFLTSCRSCHGGMDSMAGAFAYFNAVTGNGGRPYLAYSPGQVQQKLNQNGNVFSSGYVTTDDSWINHWTKNQNESIGWSGATSGNGANALGTMLANSQAFPACMAKRVFQEVCRREASDDDAALLASLAQDFKSSGYKLKRLFERTAVSSACLGK